MTIVLTVQVREETKASWSRRAHQEHIYPQEVDRFQWNLEASGQNKTTNTTLINELADTSH